VTRPLTGRPRMRVASSTHEGEEIGLYLRTHRQAVYRDLPDLCLIPCPPPFPNAGDAVEVLAHIAGLGPFNGAAGGDGARAGASSIWADTLGIGSVYKPV